MKRQSEKILISGEKACVIQPSLAKLLGRSAAHILQHIHYALQNDHLGKKHSGQKWVYNTYESWQESIQIYSEITIRRAISKLESMGILLSDTLSAKKSDRTKWYTINYEVMEKITGSPTKRSDVPIKLINPHDQNDQIIIEQKKHTKINLINQTPSHNDERVVKSLFDMWITIVSKKEEILLTKKRSQHLMAALKFKFNGCIDQWKRFCETVASSDFLMGRVKASFKASLDWVLKFDVIQRILEGDFGVKKEALHASSSEKMNSASEEDYIQAQQESNEIKKLRMDLLNRVGEGAYRSWFKPVPIIKKDTGFSMMGQGTFWKNYVNTHYKNVLMALCVDV